MTRFEKHFGVLIEASLERGDVQYAVTSVVFHTARLEFVAATVTTCLGRHELVKRVGDTFARLALETKLSYKFEKSRLKVLTL